MPEGHTIHRLARDLTEAFARRTVTCSSPQGRFAAAASLSGQVFRSAHAIGKHLFLAIGEARVHIHLGLFGKFRRRRAPDPPRASVRLRLEHDDVIWDLTGPTACAIASDEEYQALRARLGGDPLAEGTRSAAIWRRLHRSKRPIGALLLDQSLFAGIGNVYRAELLFLVQLHPDTHGCDIPKRTFERMWKLAKELLERGVRANRIVTVPGASRRRRDQLYVYKQRACRVCGSAIVRAKIAARTIYYCRTCQPFADQRLP